VNAVLFRDAQQRARQALDYAELARVGAMRFRAIAGVARIMKKADMSSEMEALVLAIISVADTGVLDMQKV
jgi:hypothetical protein